MIDDPHANQDLILGGEPLGSARVAVVLFHGRGSNPQSMQNLFHRFERDDLSLLAPAARDGSWWPKSAFIDPALNAPFVESAMAAADRTVARVLDAGVRREHIVLGGFSQGACLAVEWAARNPARYGAIFVLSGAMLGAPGHLSPHAGSLHQTPCLVGCSQADPWIPADKLDETVAELERIDGVVERHTFEGDGHAIRELEVERMRALLAQIA